MAADEPLDTTPAGEPGDYPFWPIHALNRLMLLYLLVGLLLSLAILLPFGLQGQADPLHTPAAVKPQWYFLALDQFLTLAPRAVGPVGVGLFFLAMCGWPFIDEALARRLGHRKVSTVVGWGVLLLVLGLTALGGLRSHSAGGAPAAVAHEGKAAR